MTPSLDADLVRCLVREQFPEWADLPIVPVDVQGWDNRTFRIGTQLSARLPSAAAYAPAVAKEQRWLPFLAGQLPVPIPSPVAAGRPGCGYPLPWLVCRWLAGEPLRADRVDDLAVVADDVAQFLHALRQIDATDGPLAGPHSFGRGGPLRHYDEQTRELAFSLQGRIDVSAVLAVWDAALDAGYDGAPLWLHGDMTAGNLLVAAGRLCAVIDFGTCAVGDPACDLVFGWTFLDGTARENFLGAVAADPAERTRGRGWALWKALLTLAEDPASGTAERRYGWRFSAADVIGQLIADDGG
jgi:aminoglycoside phosphotransferase (APT) family kinase protein